MAELLKNKPISDKVHVIINILKLNRDFWSTEEYKQKGESLLEEGYTYLKNSNEDSLEFADYCSRVFKFADEMLENF